MSNFMSYANATELFTEIGNKFHALAGAYVIKGNSAFASLPATPTAAEEGYVYNVTDAFTTDARFVEGAGKAYPANTNVVIVNLGSAGSPDVKYDVLGSFVDVAGIEAEIQAVSDMIAGEFDATTAYAAGDVVVYDGDLYKFTAAHAAGAWSGSDATQTTVVALINAAEPDELTTAQINALKALL